MKKLEYLDENTGIECYPDYLAHSGEDFNYIEEIKSLSEINWMFYEELIPDHESTIRNFSVNLSSGKQNITINVTPSPFHELLNQIPSIEAFHAEDGTWPHIFSYIVYFVREGYTKEQSITDINLVANEINQDIKVLQSS